MGRNLAARRYIRGVEMIRAAIFLAALLAPAAASAHSWYAWECCHDRDCHPIADVVETPQGYVVLSETIPHGDSRLRVSQDAEFHVCQPNPPAIRCLYVPGRAF